MNVLSSPPSEIGAFEPHAVAAPNVLFEQPSSLYYYVDSQRTDHPDTLRLVGLVCEAVLEVVCVSSLGYIAAKRGLFSQKVQKDVANLNIYFFTPCLIFSKLAAQLTGDKLTELWIIPVILFVQTMLSWAAAEGLTRVLQINKKPQRNFVKAMAVFGNSNSLPLSLVISLSHTISGLHWDNVPGDNDDEVGARGILYLLVFSQLGQAVRWSWGMNTLLKPMKDYTPEERGEIPRDEEQFDPYKDDPNEAPPAKPKQASALASASSSRPQTPPPLIVTDEFGGASSTSEPAKANGRLQHRHLAGGGDFDGARSRSRSPFVAAAVEYGQHTAKELRGWRKKTFARVKTFVGKCATTIDSAGRRVGHSVFSSLPQGLQKILTQVWHCVYVFVAKVLSCLNVPLVAIIVSVLVGSVPSLKAFFYTKGSFVNNTVIQAVEQLAGVAVPLILFVLGGNLCQSTVEDDDGEAGPEIERERSKMMWCAIFCRMVVPLVLMAPFLAVIAKFTPISILDDPIFIIVCFLLTGAPSALQLAQICQVNEVFVPVISKLLVQSYVVWIFPSTLILVMLALEVVKWAAE